MITVTKKGLKSLFTKLGYKTCDKWSAKKFMTKVKALPELVTDKDIKNAKLNAKLTKRLAKLMKAVKKGTKIEIIDVKDGSTKVLEREISDAKQRATDKKSGKKKTTKKKGVGVIATILDIITNQGPISKKALLAKLTKKFPDNAPEGMSNTITATPRYFKNKGGPAINKDDDGKYFVGKAKSKSKNKSKKSKK